MLDRVSMQSPSPQLRTANREGINHSNQNETEIVKKSVQSQNKVESTIQDEQLVSKEQVQAVVESFNQFLQPSHTSLNFEYHEKSNKYSIQVVDQKTNETIMEIPSKQIMDAYASMLEFVGIMVDKKI